MPSQWINYTALKQASGFLPILAHYGIKAPARTSGSVKVLCPFHDDEKPSLSVDVTVGTSKFQCFSCHKKGNVLDFVQAMDGCDLPTAAALVADLNSIDVPTKDAPARGSKLRENGAQGRDSTNASARPATRRQEAPAKREQGLRDVALDDTVNRPLTFTLKLDPSHPYLDARMESMNLGDESPDASTLIETFGLGFCNRGMMQNRLCIPIHNAEGELVAYAGRWALGEAELPDGEDKYKLPPKFRKSRELFNLHRAVALSNHEPATDAVVVTEGYFGAIRLHALGVPTVALMGSSISPDQIRLLSADLDPSRVVLLLDGDAPGKRAATEQVLPALAKIFHVRNATDLLEDGQQPDELSDGELLSLVLR